LLAAVIEKHLEAGLGLVRFWEKDFGLNWYRRRLSRRTVGGILVQSIEMIGRFGFRGVGEWEIVVKGW